MIVALLAILTWCLIGYVYWRGEVRWEKFENQIIPGSPQVRVVDVLQDKSIAPWAGDEPVYMGRLAGTKAAQLEAARTWAKVSVIK